MFIYDEVNDHIVNLSRFDKIYVKKDDTTKPGHPEYQVTARRIGTPLGTFEDCMVMPFETRDEAEACVWLLFEKLAQGCQATHENALREEVGKALLLPS